MDNLTPITREEMLMNDEPLTPITREEKILAGEDLTPVTRREYFLKKYRHAGGDVMVEGLSVTENGTYTAPEGKAYSPVEVNVPMPENAYLLKTASGSLVSFADGTDLPMPSFICNIDAVQDLHGYDSPWTPGGGKNLLEIMATSNSEMAGITYTIKKDSDNNKIGIVVDGSATALSYAIIATGDRVASLSHYTTTLIPAGTEIKTCPTPPYVTLNFRYTDGTYEINVQNQTITLSKDVGVVYIQVGANTTVSNQTVEPYIYLATETDPTFAPYENICPISGHTGVDAWVRGKNLWSFGDITQPIDGAEFHLKAGTYTIKADVSNAGTTLVGLRMFYADDTNILVTLSNTNNYQKTFALTSDVVKINASVTNGTATNVQLELGETATTYEPYNSNSQTIQVSWQTEAGEVYGGYVDLVSGILTVDRVCVTYSDTDRKYNDSFRLYPVPNNALVTNADNEQPSPLFICDKYRFMSIAKLITTSAVNVGIGISKTSSGFYIKDTTMLQMTLEEAQTYLSSHPIDVVYPLATPQTYQLTPTQIKSLLGTNNAWCSTGDVDINYFAKEVEG